MNKVWLGLSATAVLLVVALAASASAHVHRQYRGPFPVVRVQVDGRPLTAADVPPIVVDGRTMLPVRATAALFAAEVRWDAETSTVHLTKEFPTQDLHGMAVLESACENARAEKEFVCDILEEARAVAIEEKRGPVPLGPFAGGWWHGYPTVRVVVNGELIASDVPPFVVDGRTLLPVRALANAFGASIWWQPETETVVLKTPTTTITDPALWATRHAMTQARSDPARMRQASLASNLLDQIAAAKTRE